MTDYDAPLSEAGDYTDKYYAAKDLIARYSRVPNIVMPELPAESVKTAYPSIQATQHLTLENLLSQLVRHLTSPPKIRYYLFFNNLLVYVFSQAIW